FRVALSLAPVVGRLRLRCDPGNQIVASLLAFLMTGSSFHGGENSCRDGELVRSGLCRVQVSKENARGRSPRLVRATFRYGRVKLVILFSPGSKDGAPLAREHAGQLRFQRQTASIALASFHAGKISPTRDGKNVALGQERQGRTHTGSGARDDRCLHACARGFAAR